MAPPLPVLARHATIRDSAPLWQWRNDPASRAASFDRAPVPREAHRAWLDRILGHPERHRLVIGETPFALLGAVRLDIGGKGRTDEGIVSVVIAPGQRGLGMASRLLVAAEPFFPESLTLVAEIREDNQASLESFRRAGYAGTERRNGTAVMVKVRQGITVPALPPAGRPPARPAGSEAGR